MPDESKTKLPTRSVCRAVMRHQRGLVLSTLLVVTALGAQFVGGLLSWPFIVIALPCAFYYLTGVRDLLKFVEQPQLKLGLLVIVVVAGVLATVISVWVILIFVPFAVVLILYGITRPRR